MTAGEQWIRPNFWSVAASDFVYQAGYVPARSTPMEDFLSKMTIKVVVDGGTKHEKTPFFGPAAVRTDVSTFQVFPGGVAFPTDSPMASLLPRMSPLSIGTHSSAMSVIMTASHCDGLGTDVYSCLPTGETPFSPRRSFTVTQP